MVQCSPYIRFNNNSRDALALYARVFGGETVFLQTLGQSGQPFPPGQADGVMHAEFRAPGVHFYCTDCGMGPIAEGNRFAMSLTFTDEAEQQRVFDALAEGGKVTHPLQDMFWNAKFGMLVDRFGIDWMLNCPRQ